jgi:hypothetical protein
MTITKVAINPMVDQSTITEDVVPGRPIHRADQTQDEKTSLMSTSSEKSIADQHHSEISVENVFRTARQWIK